MSVDTVAPTPERVGWKDLTWIAWRQHRAVLMSTGVFVVGVAVMMAVLGIVLASHGSTDVSILTFQSPIPPAEMLAMGVTGYAGLVAAFWAAPLLSREYEQRTHMLVWSQDVSAARWVAGKAVALVSVAVAFALVLGIVGNLMAGSLEDSTAQLRYFSRFDELFFGMAPLVQVGYVLFGFALGLAVSAITRRTVLSIGLTAGIFFVVRVVIAQLVRPYYQTPERITSSIDERGVGISSTNDRSLQVESGLLDGAGNTMEYPAQCYNTSFSGIDGFTDCLRANGAVGNFRDFQPIERLETFQYIEFGVFTALAVVLFVVTNRVMRRVTRL